jgi:hypothetical protein
MPEIRSVTIQPVQLPAIKRIPEARTLPDAPPVTLQLGMPVVELPGCVAVHPDAKLNPSLLQDDPGRVGAFCPEGQVPSFVPMDFTPSEIQILQQSLPQSSDDSDDEPEAPKPAPVPRIPAADSPEAQATEATEPDKPFIEQAIDGLPPVGAVVTTTTIALVAATSALVAKPLADLILKLIKPTVKKVVKKASQLRGKPVRVDSLLERRLAQRDRNRALRALRRALKA